MPITPSILKKLQSVWVDKDSSFKSVMLWAVSLVTFCRLSKVTVKDENRYDPATHPSFCDLSIDNTVNPKVISLMIKHSKTDQGIQVFLGRTNDDLCPVSSLLVYLSR